MRGCHSPRMGWITAAGSSSPQSTRIVQRKRRPTSNVDSMVVLRARRGGAGPKKGGFRGGRGGTGSKWVTFRGGMRGGAIPFLLVGQARGKMLNRIWDGTVLPACVLPR